MEYLNTNFVECIYANIVIVSVTEVVRFIKRSLTLLLISEGSYQDLKQQLLMPSTLKRHIILIDSLLLKVPSCFLKLRIQRYQRKWRVLKKLVIWNRGLYTAWEICISEYQIHTGSSLVWQFVYLNLKHSSLAGE